MFLKKKKKTCKYHPQLSKSVINIIFETTLYLNFNETSYCGKYRTNYKVIIKSVKKLKSKKFYLLISLNFNIEEIIKKSKTKKKTDLILKLNG